MRVIGVAEFERAIDRIDWIAESPILTPGHIELHVGTARTSWHVRIRDTKANRLRLGKAVDRAYAPRDYGTEKYGNRG